MSDAETNQHNGAESDFPVSSTGGSGPITIGRGAEAPHREESTAEKQIRRAHEAFTKAVEEVLHGNPAPMAEIWSHDEGVTAAHPVGHWAIGWEQVWTGWVEIASLMTDGELRTKNLQIRVYGNIAYTTYSEQIRVSFQDQVVVVPANVTNIWVLTPNENGAGPLSKLDSSAEGTWKLVHHHADRSHAAERVVDLLID